MTESNELPEILEKPKINFWVYIITLLCLFIISFVILSIIYPSPSVDNGMEGTQPVLVNDTCGGEKQPECQLASASSDIKINIVGGSEQ